MGISEVRSPVSTGAPGKLSSGQPRTFPSRTTPGRADQHEPEQSPMKARVSLGGEPAEITVTGPQEKHGERSQERQSPEE